MKENLETTQSQKPPAGEKEDSLFLKAYQQEKQRIGRMDDQIMERLKFLEKEQDPKIREKIEAEIAGLRAEKLEARQIANMALKDQQESDEDMEADVSSLTH